MFPRRLPALLLLAAMAACADAPPAAVPLPGAGRLPADAAVYVAVSDRAAFLKRLDESPAARAAAADPTWDALASDAGLAAMGELLRRESGALDGAARPAAALCGQRNRATGRLTWTALVELKTSAPDAGPRQVGAAWTAVQDGLLVAAADETSLRAFLDSPSDPPRAVRSCAPRALAAGEAYVFLALDRWAPAALAAWHLRLSDLEGLGLRVAFGPAITVRGVAEARPSAYRDLLARQVRAPRRDPRLPAGATAAIVQSGPLGRVADRIRESAPREIREGCATELASLDQELRARGSSLPGAFEGTGWAFALLPDGDAVPSAVALVDLDTPRRASDLNEVIHRLHARPPKSGYPRSVPVTHLPCERLESRAAGRHLFLWRPPEHAEPPANAGLQDLLHEVDSGGVHGFLRVTGDSLPLLARELGPVAALLNGPEAPAEFSRAADALRWIRSLEVRTLWGDRGAELEGVLEIAGR